VENLKTNNSTMMYFLVNLSTRVQPKFINLGTCYSKHETNTFTQLFKKYWNVFTWTYEYLKTYDTHIILQIIFIKDDVKSFQQNLRKIHPTLESPIQKELKKLIDAKIIFKVRNSTSISNLVPVRKKSREIGPSL